MRKNGPPSYLRKVRVEKQQHQLLAHGRTTVIAHESMKQVVHGHDVVKVKVADALDAHQQRGKLGADFFVAIVDEWGQLRVVNKQTKNTQELRPRRTRHGSMIFGVPSATVA